MKILFIIIMLITISSCSLYKKNCFDYKTGLYKYTKEDYEDWFVSRNDTLQIEYNKKSGVKITGIVEWLSDCKFTITYKEFIGTSQNNMINEKITIEITKTSKNTYSYIAKNKDIVMKGEMIKIK